MTMEKFSIRIEEKGGYEYLVPKILNLIEEVIENKIELGRGRAGLVFTSENETFCIKEIVDSNALFSSNNIGQEFDIQKRAIEGGVRSPKLILSLETEDRKFLIMERINGGSLKDIKEGKIEKPKNFDHKEFFDKLAEQVEKLHNASVHHRDLHEGNIMFEIKKDTEIIEPVIIDYGLSSVVYGDDENPYSVDNFPRPGETTRFPKDIDEIRRVRREAQEYLT
jgi:serine/threonine protein kinase